MARPWTSMETRWAVFLGLLALATRGAFRGQNLYSYDSGLLASGIESFDFASGYPHPPYYPLTIAAGKPLALLVGPIHALVWLSVLASVVVVVFSFAIAFDAGGRTAGLVAGLVVLASPVSLFNGIAPLSYALEGAGSAAVAWAAWRCRAEPSTRWAVTLGCVASVALGLRPSALFFLGPIVLWAAWPRWRVLAQVATAGGLVTLGWLVPMIEAGGGWAAFVAGSSYQSRHLVFRDTLLQKGWGIVGRNLGILASYVPHELPFLYAMGILGAGTWWLRRRRTAPGRIVSFLACWGLPPLAFYVFVYVGWPVFPSGYVMVLVPVVAVASGLAISAATKVIGSLDRRSIGRWTGTAVVAVAVLVPATWVVAWPSAVEPQREAEAWMDSWAGLTQVLPPNETALVAFVGWHWARLELPDYVTWGIQPYWNETQALLLQVAQSQHGRDDRPHYANALDGPNDAPHPIPPWVRRIVLFDGPTGGPMNGFFKADVHLENATLPTGRTATFFSPDGVASIEATLRGFRADGSLDVSSGP